jgi:hypothetical protein
MSEKALPLPPKLLAVACGVVVLVFAIDAVEAGLHSNILGVTKSSAFALGFAVLLWMNRQGASRASYVASPRLRSVFLGSMLVGTVALTYELVAYGYELFARYAE